MTETETDEMKITVISQELFQEAVRTLPLSPKHFELHMLANGIVPAHKDEEIDGYIAECLGKNIIPFSEVTFEYNQKKHLFVPTEQKIWGCEESTKKLVEGARFNRIDLKPGFESSTGFNDLKKRGGFLDLLLKNDYQFYRGDLCLKNGGGCYISEKGLELEFMSSINEEDRGNLVGWFKELEDKYQHKQKKLFS